MIKIQLDNRLLGEIQRFTRQEQARIRKTVNLFSEKGFYTNKLYLKKLTKHIWELKPGRVRLLFGLVRGIAVFVNIFIKKSQKTPLKEIKLAEKRISEYI